MQSIDVDLSVRVHMDGYPDADCPSDYTMVQDWDELCTYALGIIKGVIDHDIRDKDDLYTIWGHLVDVEATRMQLDEAQCALSDTLQGFRLSEFLPVQAA